MTEKVQQLSHVVTLEADEAATALERLAEGLRRGRLHLEAMGADVRLRPTRSIRTELRIRGSGAEVGGRIELDLRWTRLAPDPAKDPEPKA